ncbi:uncharacterized membrane protein YjfL (UPF0719 family) [Rhizobium sp. BK226]|uniref:hypothetical protein n=1 Tax=Rhizobium sp. BK226 TaxID=2587075 RepID=UPI0017F12678|nr:hypothetical protein [Rhizobium sp. BK226]MBB4114574.1 uncharacterized membrane protein YjfL (UPF0719 family) [Rhizobium sp. BK226]
MSAARANRSCDRPLATRKRRKFQPMVCRTSMREQSHIRSLTIDGLTVPYYCNHITRGIARESIEREIMKIAVGIIGIFLGLLVLMQSCAVTAGSGLLQDKATGGAGAIGMLVGLLFFIAGAFSFALPLVGAIMFTLAAAFAFIASTSGSFSDITIWGFIALVLAVMSFFTWRSAKRKQIA